MSRAPRTKNAHPPVTTKPPLTLWLILRLTLVIAHMLFGFLLAFLLVWLWDVRDIEGPAWRPRYRTLITAGAAIALAFALEQALSM